MRGSLICVCLQCFQFPPVYLVSESWASTVSLLRVPLFCIIILLLLLPSVLLVSPSLSMQPHYHSGSLPEFLLSLLTNWRPPAKKHPAVSFGCSELRRASSVCASSSSSACRLPPVLTPTPCVLLLTSTRVLCLDVNYNLWLIFHTYSYLVGYHGKFVASR